MDQHALHTVLTSGKKDVFLWVSHEFMKFFPYCLPKVAVNEWEQNGGNPYELLPCTGPRQWFNEIKRLKKFNLSHDPSLFGTSFSTLFFQAATPNINAKGAE